jgi:predicted permease
MTRRPPGRLLAAGRWLLRRRLPPDLAEEADGDLRELWARRAAAGRRGLVAAYLVDLAGLVLERRPGAVPGPVRSRHARIKDVFDMRHDLRYALRLIRRQPLGSSVTIATLALGMAASTGIFTTVDRLLLQPLPYPEPARLMAVHNVPFSFAGGGMDVASGARALDVFDGIGVYAEGGLKLDRDGAALRLPAGVVSPGFFEAMAVTPQIGRVYTYDDMAATDHAVAVISDGLWRRLFGADPAVLDRPLYINRRAFRILGVMPRGFTFPGASDVWIPVFSDRQATGSAFAPDVVARLAPGMSPEAAVAALERFSAERGAPPPDDDSQRVRLTPLQAELTQPVRPTLLLLTASVGLVLLVSTTNVAGLLLARVTERQAEYVLRRALGGSRWRLVRLLTVEALVLAGLAGVLGTMLAAATLRSVATISTSGVPPMDLGIDARMLAIALAVSLTAGFLFGLAPGLAAASQAPAQVMRASSTATASPRWRRVRHALVLVQVAAALVLLAVTTTTLQTMARLSRVDLGFRGDSVLGFTVTLPLATYSGPETIPLFAEQALARFRSLPGVVSAGATGRLPGDRTTGVGLPLWLPGELEGDRPRRSFSALAASPGYFDAMGIRILAGGDFTETDVRGAPPVIILSESAVRALWPDGRSPIGLTVRQGVPPQAVLAEVVGVVADVLLRGPIAGARPEQMYRPVAQLPPFGSLSFALRASVEPASIVPSVRAALAGVDRTLPAYDIRPMRDVAAGFLSAHRLAMTLLGLFATLTLTLAAVGIYGVLAHLVAARTRELGIRVALGADASRLQRGVVLSGLRLAGSGVAVGLLLTGVAARAVSAFVPDLDAIEWRMVGLDATVILLIAAVAAWFPARRAASIDVAGTLRA